MKKYLFVLIICLIAGAIFLLNSTMSKTQELAQIDRSCIFANNTPAQIKAINSLYWNPPVGAVYGKTKSIYSNHSLYKGVTLTSSRNFSFNGELTIEVREVPKEYSRLYEQYFHNFNDLSDRRTPEELKERFKRGKEELKKLDDANTTVFSSITRCISSGDTINFSADVANYSLVFVKTIVRWNGNVQEDRHVVPLVDYPVAG